MSPDPADNEQLLALLREHVPEVKSGLIRVKEILREPRHSVLVVACTDPRGDPVGTCVGPQGERVKRIVSALGGEKIDIIRWDESAERFIANLLAPSSLVRISFDDSSREATVLVRPRPGSRHTNLGLRSEVMMNLTGWKLRIQEQPEG